MAALTFDHAPGRRARRAAGIIALLAALATAAVAFGTAPSSAGAQRADVLGQTKRAPSSQCPSPARNCQAVGRLTGFQARATGSKNPFVVPRDGHLVAWSVDLTSKPKTEQRKFFGKLYGHKPFGAAPSARIAVLTKRKGKKFRLRSRSPAMALGSYIGERPIFTLGRPLRVKKGDIVAITLPTWTSAFAVGLPAKQNSWRASRPGKACDIGTKGKGRKNLRNSKPQEKEGSTRAYGCTYRGARLLYWGYYVPSGGGGGDE